MWAVWTEKSLEWVTFLLYCPCYENLRTSIFKLQYMTFSQWMSHYSTNILDQNKCVCRLRNKIGKKNRKANISQNSDRSVKLGRADSVTTLPVSHLKCFQKHISVFCLAVIWESLWPTSWKQIWKKLDFFVCLFNSGIVNHMGCRI